MARNDTGLPWGLSDEARSPGLLREGAWIIVGSGRTRAVAQIADIDGSVVHVRPLPGPVAKHLHLVGHLAT